ncbi:Cell adhesion molecule 2, partial [Dissostichus eleginoides]
MEAVSQRTFQGSPGSSPTVPSKIDAGAALKDCSLVQSLGTEIEAHPWQSNGGQGQFPITQNVTVVEGGSANMTCRVDYNDNTSLQWSNPAQQTLFFGDKKALRDNRIELIRASSQELTIKVGDVSLSDDGLYTCSLFTMPVKTTKAFLTVL